MICCSPPPHVPHPLSQQVPYFVMPCPPRQPNRTSPPPPFILFSRHLLTQPITAGTAAPNPASGASLCVYPGPLGSASILLGPCSSTPQCSQPANRPRSLFNLSINIKYDTVGSVDLILQKVSGAERYRLKLSQFMSLNYYNMQRVNNMWSWAAMCFCWSDMRNCHVFKTFTAIVMVLSSYQVRHFV